MKLQTFVNKIATENTYLLTSIDDEGQQLLIDPGSDLAYLPSLNRLSSVLLTHAHFDHIWGLEAVLRIYPHLSIYLAETEKDWTHFPKFNASTLLMGQGILSPDATDFYDFTKKYQLAGFEFEVRSTPGHSIGGVSLIFPKEKKVFTGDILFKNTIGRTDLPTGNYDLLIKSVKTELFSLPDDYKIYPGHGPKSTIGEEKVFNPFF